MCEIPFIDFYCSQLYFMLQQKSLLLFFSPVALRIHVSNESHARLVELGGFYFEERGQVQIKVTLKRGLF